MKLVIAVIYAAVAFLALATFATAAPSVNLCNKDGWATAQSSSGLPFTSHKECQKAKDVFQPSLAISPTHVVAAERFTLTASGFHPNAAVSVSFAITGQAPYGSYSPPTRTLSDGSYSLPFVFAACGNSPDNLTITLVDSYGVHASAQLTLC